MSINTTAFFCRQCNVPLLHNQCEKCHNISTTKIPLKASPVFQEELNMLSDVTGFSLNKFGPLNLWTANRYYYFKGQKIFKLIGGDMYNVPKIKWLKDEKRIYKELKSMKPKIKKETRKIIKEANRFTLGTLEEKAINFIKETRENLKDKIILTAVSFSGGKDSAVVSHLARKALGNRVLHFFSDTTIEHPSTLEYIEKFHDSEKLFLLSTKPATEFMDIVNKAQMPSRIHRWCCSMLKASNIENFVKKIADNGKKVLTLDGVRWEESKRRQSYSQIFYETKIPNNMTASPIIDWSSLEEWLYILSENILLNEAYRRGFKRIGCVVCPFSPEYPEFLVDYYSKKDTKLNAIWTSFKELLIKAVEGRQDVPDPERFLAEGKWKVRAGSFKKNDIIAIRGCLIFEDLFFDLSEIEFKKLKEYIKPLGQPFIEGDYILLLNKNDISAKFKFEENTMTAVIYEPRIKQLILKQIIKAKFCSNCGICQIRCPVDAINGNHNSYTINADKCIGCNECINISSSGCIIATSLKTSLSIKNCQA